MPRVPRRVPPRGGVELADLLGRPAVDLDTPLTQRFLAGKRVLVTGAGGSIGSEICRQAMPFCPSRLLLLERAENNLFEIDRELREIRGITRRPLETQIARGNLTGPQQSVMSVLVRAGPISVKDLSAQLGLAHSTTSGIIDRLEKHGMVERQPDENDRRLSRITITEEVKEFVTQTMPKLSINPLAKALKRATPRECEAILGGLRSLRKLLQEAADA